MNVQEALELKEQEVNGAINWTGLEQIRTVIIILSSSDISLLDTDLPSSELTILWRLMSVVGPSFIIPATHIVFGLPLFLLPTGIHLSTS